MEYSLEKSYTKNINCVSLSYLNIICLNSKDLYIGAGHVGVLNK